MRGVACMMMLLPAMAAAGLQHATITTPRQQAWVPRMVAGDDDDIGLQRVQAALLQDAADANRLRETLLQTLSLFPQPNDELQNAISGARSRLNDKKLSNAGEDPRAADRQSVEFDMLQKIQALRATGKSDDDIMKSVSLMGKGDTPNSAGSAATATPAVPSRGEAEWGSWTHTSDSVNLELYIEEGVQAKSLNVEIAEGWLGVETGKPGVPPLLVGRLAQPVQVSELMWAVDEASDGQRVLCIELPKKDGGRIGAAQADCIFDETLHIEGKPCLVPGLSQGTITLDLPEDLRPE